MLARLKLNKRQKIIYWQISGETADYHFGCLGIQRYSVSGTKILMRKKHQTTPTRGVYGYLSSYAIIEG